MSKAYTRRKWPDNFTTALPRASCPYCNGKIDVRIKRGAMWVFPAGKTPSLKELNKDANEMEE